jgi:glucose-6-phosphate 1-epimerase
MNLPDCIHVEEPEAGYPVYVIRHPAASARVALHGAHLMEWTPAGQAPVLYLSPQALHQAGKPIRGGIPVCWPWFGADAHDPSKPMHGFARIRFWNLIEATATGSGVRLIFSFTGDAETLALWPHPFSARVEMRIGHSIEVRLATRNTGTAPFELTEALHTHLHVGDVTQVIVRGLADLPYLDTVGPATRHQQAGDIIIDQEVDRRYESPGPVVVEDSSLQRHIHIDNEGSNTVVVWNPWVEKSKRLSDLPDNDFPRFLCIEAANAAPSVIVTPGEEHEIVTRVRVAPL